MTTGGRDKKNPDKKPKVKVEHYVEQNTFYREWETHVKDSKDKLITLIYTFFVIAVLLSVFINLQEGKFPFNIRFLADTAYSKKKWGTPLAAFLVALALTAMYLLLRIGAANLFDNSVYNTLIHLFRINNLLVPVHKHEHGKSTSKTSEDTKNSESTKRQSHGTEREQGKTKS